ncbi:hypothetical protein JKF63_05956 [Porcisia hertigi]|uniref:Transcription elongation factor 1 homolog n=1 Tax=Porcisia hertigi TaxID=2761500 RepID=A0A836LIB9_9TRYP|nr:hypothetical protein JKF63_05956 [Porcisia hertigi]
MSDTREGARPRRGQFASRKARGETGGGGASSDSKKNKEHSFDARRYHQNANTHGIHALRTFDCPVCDSKNTIRVTLSPRLRQGTVSCTYCCSLRPVPPDLPYPSVQTFVPSLENKADVFFRFNEQYTALLRLDSGEHVGGPAGSDSHWGAAVDNKRKRACEDDNVSGERTGRARGEHRDESGLFDVWAPDMDADPLDETVVQEATGVAGMLDGDCDHNDSDKVADARSTSPKEVLTPSTERLDGVGALENGVKTIPTNAGVDGAVTEYAASDAGDIGEADGEEVDVAEFFADSD